MNIKTSNDSKKKITEEEWKHNPYWDEPHHFTEPDDVPVLPLVREEVWKKIYIPKLIEFGGIRKKDLITGKTYIGKCRNSTEATWTGHDFIYMRQKSREETETRINHFEDDNGFDLFVPLKIKE